MDCAWLLLATDPPMQLASPWTSSNPHCWLLVAPLDQLLFSSTLVVGGTPLTGAVCWVGSEGVVVADNAKEGSDDAGTRPGSVGTGARRTVNQCVCISPFPFTGTTPSRGVNQWCLPASTNRSAVVCETWIRLGSPVPSIRAAVLTVSPKSWKRLFSPRNTPAVTAPLCRPKRIPRSAVPGPNSTSSSVVRPPISRRHSDANLAMMMAWSSLGSGRPATAT